MFDGSETYSEEQGTPEVLPDPDFISIADKSLKEKRRNEKSRGFHKGSPGLVFLKDYLARSIRISLLLVMNLVISSGFSGLWLKRARS